MCFKQRSCEGRIISTVLQMKKPSISEVKEKVTQEGQGYSVISVGMWINNLHVNSVFFIEKYV